MTVIDISRYQGVVDFAALKAAGVSRAIAKVGGGDAGVYVDSMWRQNLAGIRSHGMQLGSYFFNGPGDTPTQAADFQVANSDWRPGDWLCIDVEGHGIAYTPAQALEWVNRMRWHGVPAVDLWVYMSESVENSEDWSAVVATGANLWVAAYRSNNGQPGTPPHLVHWKSWGLWQFTSNGTAPGVNGRVDMSQVAPGFAGSNVTPLEVELPAYSLLAVKDGTLVNTWIYLGLPGSFVLSGDAGNNLAEKETICAINGVADVPTLEAGVIRISTVAAQIIIGHIAVSPTAIDANALAAQLGPLIGHTDPAALAAAVTTALAPQLASIPAAVVKAEGSALSNG